MPKPYEGGLARYVDGMRRWRKAGKRWTEIAASLYDDYNVRTGYGHEPDRLRVHEINTLASMCRKIIHPKPQWEVYISLTRKDITKLSTSLPVTNNKTLHRKLTKAFNRSLALEHKTPKD